MAVSPASEPKAPRASGGRRGKAAAPAAAPDADVPSATLPPADAAIAEPSNGSGTRAKYERPFITFQRGDIRDVPEELNQMLTNFVPRAVWEPFQINQIFTVRDFASRRRSEIEALPNIYSWTMREMLAALESRKGIHLYVRTLDEAGLGVKDAQILKRCGVETVLQALYLSPDQLNSIFRPEIQSGQAARATRVIEHLRRLIGIPERPTNSASGKS